MERVINLTRAEISSHQNPRIKSLRRLMQKRERDRTGSYLIEGFHLLEEALLNGAEVESIFYSDAMVAQHAEDWQKIEVALSRYIKHLESSLQSSPSKSNTALSLTTVELITVPESIIKLLADTATPQGVLAVIRQPSRTLHSFLALGEDRPLPHLLLLDGVQDPGNVGTMIRTAEAAGFQGVILGEGSADLYNPKSIRATQGALFQIPILSGVSLLNLLPTLHEAGYCSWVTTLEDAQFYTQLTNPKRCALIMGNEGQGVSPQLQKMAKQKVKIPMLGATESLNVGVAAAILIYHLLEGNHGA